VNGVCLTVVRTTPATFEVEAIERTVSTTTLALLSRGRIVNLERALKLDDRLGGHLVTGHVDAVGTVVAIERARDRHDIRVELPADLMLHVVERGSIAIDGVSLTVAETDRRSATVSLIPETLSSTIAGSYRVGTPVNVETDIVAKYLEAASRRKEGDEGSGGRLTIERLKELGFKGR
jgi:riboflavin synthase